MSTVIRPELSRKNENYISKHRFYELKHFCLQYPEWKKECAALDGYSAFASGTRERVDEGDTSDPTERAMEKRLFYRERMDILERAAKEAADDLAWLLIEAVTNGYSYEVMVARRGIPCCKEVWYNVYRRFFWVLDKMRK